MTAGFLPLLAAATQTVTPVPYPAREVLAAFATACSGVEDTAVNLASAAAGGWERLAPDADTPVSRLARAGGDALKADQISSGGTTVAMEGAEFRRTVAGRTLFLAVSGARDGRFASRGCRMYDFAAPRPFTPEELHDWSVREPTASASMPDGSSKVTYNPGLKPGHTSLEVYFIPPGAASASGFELSGLSLVASALEL